MAIQLRALLRSTLLASAFAGCVGANDGAAGGLDGGGIDVDGDTTDANVEIDAATDTQGDSDSTDGAEDAPAEPDSDADALGELCDNRVDDDRDGRIDCDDEDCREHCGCRSGCTEVCDDEADNDGDGRIDCDDEDCFADYACDWCTEYGPGCVMRGGECTGYCEDPLARPPLDPDAAYSYIRRVSIPTQDSDARCCFDFDGDGAIDNALGRFVDELEARWEGIDVAGLIGRTFLDDRFAILFEWGRGDNFAGFWAYSATNDIDRDGLPDQDFATRSAGEGVFQVRPESIDWHGARVQFNFASSNDGVVVAGPSLVQFDISIETSGEPLALDLTILNATLLGAWVETSTGVASVDETFDVDGEAIELGGWQFGGVVPLDPIGALLNDLAADCTCAGFDDAVPVIAFGDDGTRYNLACAQTPAGDCSPDAGVFCANLAALCEWLPSLSRISLNDIDTNDNGVGDAMSIGLRLSAAGATIADPPITAEGSGE